jgi:hypothetical protein
MAKKKAGSNKSQAIREALAANPDKGPTVISEILKRQGYDVSPTYVSVVKSADKSKVARKVTRRVPMRRRASSSESTRSMDAALDFIRSAGGLAEARQILDTISQIQAAL